MSIWDECIEWDGLIDKRPGKEYGIVHATRADGRKTTTKIHRVVFAETFGPIPAGMQVCHHCDNPPCINPDHLFLGTGRENNQDAARKGRVGGQKLSVSDVLTIRKLAKSGETFRNIARAFGISERHAGRIVIGSRWSHI